jgi:hypothetical protein
MFCSGAYYFETINKGALPDLASGLEGLLDRQLTGSRRISILSLLVQSNAIFALANQG